MAIITTAYSDYLIARINKIKIMWSIFINIYMYACRLPKKNKDAKCITVSLLFFL